MSILNDQTALSFLFFVPFFLLFSSQRPLHEVYSTGESACWLYLSAARKQRSSITMGSFHAVLICYDTPELGFLTATCMRCYAHCAYPSAFTRQFATPSSPVIQWACFQWPVVMHNCTSHRKGKVILGLCRRAPFRTEKINPSAKLSTFQIPLKPVESQMQPLDAARDQLPQGRTIHALLLTYKLSLEAEGKHRVTVPMLNRYQNSCMMPEQRVINQAAKDGCQVDDLLFCLLDYIKADGLCPTYTMSKCFICGFSLLWVPSPLPFSFPSFAAIVYVVGMQQLTAQQGTQLCM